MLNPFQNVFKVHFLFEITGNVSYVKEELKPLFSIEYSKPNEIFTAKIIREDKDCNSIHYTMRKIVKSFRK